MVYSKFPIAIFYNEEEADKAEERFKLIFSKHDIPDDIPAIQTTEKEVWLPKFLLEHGMVQSASDGRRMLQQEAVKVNGNKQTEENLILENDMVIQVGKRKFLKIILND